MKTNTNARLKNLARLLRKRVAVQFVVLAALLLISGGHCKAAVVNVFPLDSSWEYLSPVGIGTSADPALVDPDFNTTFMSPGIYNGPVFSGPSPAPFGFGLIGLYPTLGTVLPDPNSGNRYTSYFRRTFTTSTPLSNLNVDVLADDGGIMYIDGVEVGRINFTPGSETFADFAGGGGAGVAGIEDALTNLPLSLATLAPGTHTFAMSVHQVNAFSSDLGFNLALNATNAGPPPTPIQVPLGGATEQFPFAPAAQAWSQVSLAGAAADIPNESALDTRVNTLTAAAINTPLQTVNVQQANPVPTYNSTAGNLQTGPTGNAASIVLSSLQNATGSTVSSLLVSYELGVGGNTGGVEEILGHRVYYSTTGDTNSWTPVGTFGYANGPGGVITPQQRQFDLNLGSWANGANLYLMFADDNGSGSPDQWFTIDNVNFMPTLASGGGGVLEPVAITAAPASGTSRAVGQTIQIANAAPSAGNTRDAAALSGLSVTTSSLGSFSQTGLSNGEIAAGSSQSGTVTFNGAGLLNGYHASGNLAFTIASGPTAGGTGVGAYNYPLTATVTGNVGNGFAPVTAGGSYAGLSGTSGLATIGEQIHIDTTATILAGVNSNGGPTSVSMSWSLRNLNEQRVGGTHPPLPSFASNLISDKLELTGTDGDIFVLQMTYNPGQMAEFEAANGADGQVFLASFDTNTGFWVNAVSMNHGVNVGATNVQGGWATAGGSTLALGAWGVDIVNNVVWAVLDHNSLFASVPEPSTIVLGLMGLVGLVGFARRRKA